MLRSRQSFAVFLILLLSPLLARPQSPSFSVGTASAVPGQKSTGYLEVLAGVDAATNIPVVVINGVKPGPVLALVTGAHGSEYVSVVAVEKLAGTVESDDVALLVNGTLSTMRALKMLPGDPRRIENPVWLEKIVDVISDGPASGTRSLSAAPTSKKA